MLGAVVVMTSLAAVMGFALTLSARRLDPDEDAVVERVNALLPQTQCGQCGYPGCRPYAAAIAAGEAPINRCPPGGQQTIKALSQLLGRPVEPLDEAFGHAGPPIVAFVDESICIGCARCITACPVDAILGASRFTHTVITAECTGCELCIAPCPVDCISMRQRGDRADIKFTG